MYYVTVLIVPTETDIGGQCQIVMRDGEIRNALRDYRRDYQLWKRIGVMDSRGQLVCCDGSNAVKRELVAAQPLAAGNVFHVLEGA